MNTDDLIRTLATGAGPVESRAVPRRYAVALALGSLGALVVVATHLGVRNDLAVLAELPMFWVRAAFAASVAATAFVALARLARPGVPLGRASFAMVAPMVAMWALAAVVLVLAEPMMRAMLVLGSTWKTCPLNITLVSIPVLVAVLWAIRGLAPTRPVMTGATAGRLAGGIGALVYTLHCPELEAPFLGVWYVIGMAIPAALGALLGPRILRW
ncbi:putative anti-sigma-F factor NrsF [Burkholderiales bacterium]|nr:putative anti-sigma-F factor NrsF [Burkholderiales bacterium]